MGEPAYNSGHDCRSVRVYSYDGDVIYTEMIVLSRWWGWTYGDSAPAT